jgi:uncharacterized UBP type Zn finger protein
MIASGNPEFLSNRMQDSHEYLMHLLGFLQKEDKKLKLDNDLNELFKFT